MTNLELFARLYAASRDNGRPSKMAANHAKRGLSEVICGGQRWTIVDTALDRGFVLERKDDNGHLIRRVALASELEVL